jgi:uncharacterized membrane protein
MNLGALTKDLLYKFVIAIMSAVIFVGGSVLMLA